MKKWLSSLFLATSVTAISWTSPVQAETPTCELPFFETLADGLYQVFNDEGAFQSLRYSSVQLKCPQVDRNTIVQCKVKVALSTDQGTEIESALHKCLSEFGGGSCPIEGSPDLKTKVTQPGKFKLLIYNNDTNALLFEQPFEVFSWKRKYGSELGPRFGVKGDFEKLGAFVINRDGEVNFRFYLTLHSDDEQKKLEELQQTVRAVKLELKYQGKPFATGEFMADFKIGTRGYEGELFFEPTPGVKARLKSEHFQGKDGDWLLGVLLGKKVLKLFPFKVSGGTITLHPRNAPDYTPGSRAIVSGWRGMQYHWVEHQPK